VGVKVTEMVQLAPLATVGPQEVVGTWKSPLAVMLVIFITAPPVFERVSDCVPLVVPTFWLAKLRFAGRKAAEGVTVPLPASRIVSGESPALSVMVTEPYRLPEAVGVKVTLIVQEVLAATVAPQVLVSAKSPVDPIVTIFNAALPVLVSVTV
jgi:hypothetical protein